MDLKPSHALKLSSPVSWFLTSLTPFNMVRCRGLWCKSRQKFVFASSSSFRLQYPCCLQHFDSTFKHDIPIMETCWLHSLGIGSCNHNCPIVPRACEDVYGPKFSANAGEGRGETIHRRGGYGQAAGSHGGQSSQPDVCYGICRKRQSLSRKRSCSQLIFSFQAFLWSVCSCTSKSLFDQSGTLRFESSLRSWPSRSGSEQGTQTIQSK
jgi:hypothetical protein